MHTQLQKNNPVSGPRLRLWRRNHRYLHQQKRKAGERRRSEREASDSVGKSNSDFSSHFHFQKNCFFFLFFFLTISKSSYRFWRISWIKNPFSQEPEGEANLSPCWADPSSDWSFDWQLIAPEEVGRETGPIWRLTSKREKSLFNLCWKEKKCEFHYDTN